MDAMLHRLKKAPIMSNVKAISATIHDGILTLAFGHGETLTVNPADLTKEIRDAAILHGLKQKLVDAAAITRNPETGKPASTADKFEAVMKVYTRITGKDASWNQTERTGGGSTGNAGYLVSALIRMKPQATRESIETFVDELDKTQQAALRANPKVAAIIAEIKAERKSKKATDSDIDTENLLAELDVM